MSIVEQLRPMMGHQGAGAITSRGFQRAVALRERISTFVLDGPILEHADVPFLGIEVKPASLEGLAQVIVRTFSSSDGAGPRAGWTMTSRGADRTVGGRNGTASASSLSGPRGTGTGGGSNSRQERTRRLHLRFGAEIAEPLVQAVAESVRAGVARESLFLTLKLPAEAAYAGQLEGRFLDPLGAAVGALDAVVVEIPSITEQELAHIHSNLVSAQRLGKLRHIGYEAVEQSSARTSAPLVPEESVHRHLRFSIYDGFRKLPVSSDRPTVVHGFFGPTPLNPLGDPHVAKLAQLRGRSAASILLRWAYQHGVSGFLLDTADLRCMDGFVDVGDFSLSAREMLVLDHVAVLTGEAQDELGMLMEDVASGDAGSGDVGTTGGRASSAGEMAEQSGDNFGGIAPGARPLHSGGQVPASGVDGFSITGNGIDRASAGGGGAPGRTQDATEDAGTSTLLRTLCPSLNSVWDADVGQTCWAAVWHNAGCKAAVPSYTDWHRAQTFAALTVDADQWATLSDSDHRIGCYGSE